MHIINYFNGLSSECGDFEHGGHVTYQVIRTLVEVMKNCKDEVVEQSKDVVSRDDDKTSQDNRVHKKTKA